MSDQYASAIIAGNMLCENNWEQTWNMFCEEEGIDNTSEVRDAFQAGFNLGAITAFKSCVRFADSIKSATENN